MQLSIINTGFFKLDGGAMFGVVPKTLWNRLNPADENNMCTWAMRCLLVETENRKILIDTGLGEKQDERFRSHFHPHGDNSLLKSLAEKGLKAEDITDVLLTHLHFDHVGGAVIRNDKGELTPAFPNATYWTNKVHYDWAFDPNPRERASFLKENFVPLQEAGILKFIPVTDHDFEWMDGIRLRFVYGHTEAMMVPIISTPQRDIYYCADVMPSSYHIGLPYVMGYDLRPLKTLEEKKRILEEALDGDHWLFFEHDPLTSCVSLKKNERGRIVSAGIEELNQL